MSRLGTVLITLVIALLVGVGTYFASNSKYNTDISSLKSDLSSSQTKITALEQKVAKLETATPANTASSTTDNQQLISACQAENPDLTCAVDKVDGNYATGTAMGDVEGGHWYAKKTSGTWKITLNGYQDYPMCSAVVGFPKTVVPECGQ